MRITLGGLRGTAPACGPDFIRYGGDTTCALVEGTDGDRVLLDAGTGLGRLAPRLARDPGRRELLLLLTHYHLDHLMGLPSCALLYDRAWRWTLAGPAFGKLQAVDLPGRLLTPPFWPVDWTTLRRRMRTIPALQWASEKPLVRGGLRIRRCVIEHPDGCWAYRIDEPLTGRALVWATDFEWGLMTPDRREDFIRFCMTPAPADLLFFDAQFTPTEIARHRGWGHSTWREAAEVARICGIEDVRAIHHAPDRTDRRLARIEAAARRVAPHLRFARAGQTLVPA